MTDFITPEFIRAMIISGTLMLTLGFGLGASAAMTQHALSGLWNRHKLVCILIIAATIFLMAYATYGMVSISERLLGT